MAVGADADYNSPVVGGYVAQYKSWQWTQWCMLFITLAVYIAALPMKETYKPIILKKRAIKAGIPIKSEGKDIKRLIVLKFVRPVHMLSTEVISPHASYTLLLTVQLTPLSRLYSSSLSTQASPSPFSSSYSQLSLSSSHVHHTRSNHTRSVSRSFLSVSASSSAV